MSVIIGIDVGGSTTKIVGFKNMTKDKISAEFLSEYIEEKCDILETVKIKLKEKTGYINRESFFKKVLPVCFCKLQP